MSPLWSQNTSHPQCGTLGRCSPSNSPNMDDRTRAGKVGPRAVRSADCTRCRQSAQPPLELVPLPRRGERAKAPLLAQASLVEATSELCPRAGQRHGCAPHLAATVHRRLERVLVAGPLDGQGVELDPVRIEQHQGHHDAVALGVGRHQFRFPCRKDGRQFFGDRDIGGRDGCRRHGTHRRELS
jgi:hypothetical protein